MICFFFCPVLSSGSARSPFATVSVFNVSRRLIRESMISHWKLCAYYSPCLFLLLLLFHFDCVGRGRGGGRDDSYRSNDAGRSGWGGGGGGNSYAPPDDYHRQQQQGRGYGHDQPNRYAHSLLYRFSIWIVQQLGGGSRAGGVGWHLILFVRRDTLEHDNNKNKKRERLEDDVIVVLLGSSW